MKSTIVCLLMACALSTTIAHAQTEGNRTGDDTTGARTPERLSTLESELRKLQSIRISGYVQTEWQHFDQSSSVGGRALYSDARKNFFTIRRGRIKFQHRTSSMSAVLQPDITERGVVIKDAFAEFYVLPANGLTINAGMFNRPNFEVELSSSTRESIERSQVIRAFYPDERDLGVMFSTTQKLADGFDPKLQIGLFNGVGTTPEVDAYKDIIARLTFPVPTGTESGIRINLGGSYYRGGIPQRGDSIIRTVDGTNSVVANTETGDYRGWGNREHIGAEAQVQLDLLPIGGTILRGEYLTGRRPVGAVAAVRRDSVSFTPAVAGRPLQIRNQTGFYAYFVQNIGSKLQFVAKYDLYDRNADLAGSQVTRSDDASVSVLGLGLNLLIENMRITAFYEMPTVAADEIVAGVGDLKDNKTTIRFQYRF